MIILNVLKQPWILTALMLAIAQPAFAAWQQMSKGAYVYWQDGGNFVFPIQKPNWYFWASKFADGSQQWWHPEYEDPQTHEIRYRIFWTNGSRIFEKYSTSNYWTEYQTCDVTLFRKQADTAYTNLIANTQSDFYPYYLALRNEAQSLSGACEVIFSRRPTR